MTTSSSEALKLCTPGQACLNVIRAHVAECLLLLLSQVWDLKTGQLLRTQTVHRGMVTCLAYATSAKLLFSGSIDSSIGVWTDKGNLLQARRSST